MPLNLGYIELGGGGVTVRVYYDATWLETDPTRNPDDAALIDGPRGWCLDMTNLTGTKATLTVNGVASNPITIDVQQGDPVVTGPQNGRSKTASQMAALGFTTRGNVGSISLSGN